MTARSDWTIARLKEELERKFPGKVPASIQRLFKGTQLLPGSMTVEEASEVRHSRLSFRGPAKEGLFSMNELARELPDSVASPPAKTVPAEFDNC